MFQQPRGIDGRDVVALRGVEQRAVFISTTPAVAARQHIDETALVKPGQEDTRLAEALGVDRARPAVPDAVSAGRGQEHGRNGEQYCLDAHARSVASATRLVSAINDSARESSPAPRRPAAAAR